MRAAIISSYLLLGLSFAVLCQPDTAHRSLIDSYSLEELISLKVSTADKFENRVEQVPANVVILTKREIESYGYSSLNEILSNITGCYKIEDHYWLGSSNFGIRGYFKDGPFSNIAILVNGISQQSDKYSDYPDVKITIPVEAIERIELIKGPMAVIYGNGAFFGAINIITDPSEIKQPSISSLALSYGSFGTYKGALKICRNFEDLSFNVIISADKSNGPSIPYSDMTSDTSLLRYVGLSPDARTGSQLSNTRYFGNIRLNFKGFSFDLAFNQSLKGVFDGLPSILGGTKILTNAVNLYMGYKKQVLANFSVNASAGFYTHSHSLRYNEFRKYYYEIDMQHTNSIEIDLNTQWSLSKKINLISGFSNRTVLGISQLSDFDYYGLNLGDGMAGLPDGQTYSTNSFYLQTSYSPSAHFTIVGGLRLEHLGSYNMYYARGVVSEDSADNRLPTNPADRYVIEARYLPGNAGFSFVPRLALIYTPSQNHSFKLLYGEARKQPSFSENYRQLPKNLPQLHESSIRTYEINYYATLKKNLILNMSLFYNQLNNLIVAKNVYNTQTNEWEIYSANYGSLETIGSDVSLKIQLHKKFEIELSGVLQHSRDKRKGYDTLSVPYSPEFVGYIKALYSIGNGVTIALQNHYVGAMETAWETSSTPQAGHRLGKSSKGYFLTDLNLRKENLFFTGLYSNLSCTNLFNVKYHYPVTEQNEWIDKGVPGNRQALLLSIGYKF